MGKTLDLTLRIWRQKNTNSSGEFVTYDLENVDVNASFLEMLDVLNEKLTLGNLTFAELKEFEENTNTSSKKWQLMQY